MIGTSFRRVSFTVSHVGYYIPPHMKLTAERINESKCETNLRLLISKRLGEFSVRHETNLKVLSWGV